MRVEVTVSCPVFDSFHVQQVAGMFDVPLAKRAVHRVTAEIPELGDGWQIGLIVGPSGSGKTTIARRLFGPALYRPHPWPTDRAVVDCFGQRSIKDITGTLTAVGFGSPPSWVKPYQALSNGEQFRCDLARALLAAGSLEQGAGSPEQGAGSLEQGARSPEQGAGSTEQGAGSLEQGAGSLEQGAGSLKQGGDGCGSMVDGDQLRATINHQPSTLPIVAFDEFTSVVDRNVARVASAAIAKALRTGRIPCRFVAVTCHYDVTEWLAPDWVLDMATGSFSRRCLQRPPIELAVVRCRSRAWRLFARHHYLTGALNPSAQCFLALWKAGSLERGAGSLEREVDGCGLMVDRDPPRATIHHPPSTNHPPASLLEGEPVAFCATLPLIAARRRRRISRLVTLPDYQGVGIGTALLEAVAEIHRQEGYRVNITAGHPAVIAHCRRSPRWRAVGVKKTGSGRMDRFIPGYRGSQGRAVVSFEYVGR